MANIIKRFYSTTDFIADIPYANPTRVDLAWTDGQTFDQAKRNVLIGKPETLSEAQRLIEKFDSIITLNRGIPALDLDQCGFMPCIPAYLSGEPESMFNVTDSNDMGILPPMAIYVSVSVLAEVTPKQVFTRGIAILALTMFISERRPVDLYVFGAHGNRSRDGIFPIVKINTTPLDMASATYMLTSAAYQRRLSMGWAYSHGNYDGSFAWGMPVTAFNHQSLQNKLRNEVLNASEDDIIVYPAMSTDESIAAPVKWINKQLQKAFKQES